ncbi:hypothetical protein F5Y12DRAFT_793975 [Xylaria sp. FL1777]|nr:hypothetical protein F5Y12DRAFT_793975 [Xylaria sp. FL1777]
MASQWQALPLEIKHMILEIVLLHSSKRHQKSAYAIVSKEWQTFFEKRIFHRLVLRQSSIVKFGQLIQHRRRELLQHLWLRIELPKYHRNASEMRETNSEKTKNNQIVTKAVWQLLKILTSWEKDDTRLTLELSVHSPSDSEYYLSDYCLDRDIYPRVDDEDCAYEEFYAHMSLKRRYYQVYDADGSYRQLQSHRIFARSLELVKTRGKAGLPSVQVVKRLLIRRQYVCSFSPDTLLEIIRSLSGLESISLEADTVFKDGFGGKLGEYLQSTNSLKTLSIFDENDRLRLRRKSRNKLHPSLGVALANDSCLLEHLSIAFAIDAKDFFHDFWPGDPPVASPAERHWLNPRTADSAILKSAQTLYRAADEKWPALRSLALTSALLRPDSPRSTINALLQAAANAALQMPNLRLLEIWNYDKDLDFVYIFQYRRFGSNGCPTITSSNTWGYNLEPHVVSSWSNVSNKHGGRDIRVQEQDIDLEGLCSKSYGSVVNHLQLRRLVLQPVSRCQLIWEAEIDNA